MKLTSELIRAARALLRWEQKDLARESGLSLATVKRLEAAPGPLQAQERTATALRAALERSNVIFIEDEGIVLGVRFKLNSEFKYK